jgi:isoleucyl-tRNA synthetase
VLPAQAIDWTALIALRSDVARELEQLRVAGSIGAPLDAELEIWCAPAQYRQLSVLGEELRFFMITSRAVVHTLNAAEAPGDAVPASSVEGGGVWIRVQVAQDPKCVRCWQHRPDVGASSEHPKLCARCVGNLVLPGESRRFS